MNRTDFQRIGRIRIKEAKVLLDRNFCDGAYYLAGYAVECALKACIAECTGKYEFPEKDKANASYTHELSQLIKVAGLRAELNKLTDADSQFASKRNVVRDWSEQARYQVESIGRAPVRDLYYAIASRRYGVLPWLKKHW